jgi:hypothetical protein
VDAGGRRDPERQQKNLATFNFHSDPSLSLWFLAPALPAVPLQKPSDLHLDTIAQSPISFLPLPPTSWAQAASRWFTD